MASALLMPGRTWEGPLPPLTRAEAETGARLLVDVDHVARAIGPRCALRGGALAEAAAFIETRLRGLGWTVRSEPLAGSGWTARNLAVEVTGTGSDAEIVLVGAHYDTVCASPGADDNASGLAAVLELARLLRGRRFERTVRLVFFANEEEPFHSIGQMGSQVAARASRRRGERIVAMISLESLGIFSDLPRTQAYPWPLGLFYPDRGDFLAFVGDSRSRPLVRAALASFRRHARLPSEGVAAPAWLPGIAWSDHASYWPWPAIMITDTAPFRSRVYHTPADLPEALSIGRLARATVALAAVVADLAAPARHTSQGEKRRSDAEMRRKPTIQGPSHAARPGLQSGQGGRGKHGRSDPFSVDWSTDTGARGRGRLRRGDGSGSFRT
jgi:hypothetical protein